MTKETKKKIIFDSVLVLVILALALFALLIVNLNKKSGECVLVTVNGEKYGEYPLSRDGEYKIGETNVLTVRDGVAYMTYASCKDHLCVKRGKISSVGEDITCLPNRVRAEIIG